MCVFCEFCVLGHYDATGGVWRERIDAALLELINLGIQIMPSQQHITAVWSSVSVYYHLPTGCLPSTANLCVLFSPHCSHHWHDWSSKIAMSSCIILTLKWWHLCVQVYGNTYSPFSRTVQDKLILKSYFKSLHYCLSSILWLFAVSLPSRKNMRMCSNHELFWVFCYLTLSFGTGKRGNIVTMDPIAPVTSRAS